jgi:hypothetical protein
MTGIVIIRIRTPGIPNIIIGELLSTTFVLVVLAIGLNDADGKTMLSLLFEIQVSIIFS